MLKTGVKSVKQYKSKRRDEVLPVLIQALETYHGVSFSDRFWDVIVGKHIHFALSIEDKWSEKLFKDSQWKLFQALNNDRILSSSEIFKFNVKLCLKLLVNNQLSFSWNKLEKFQNGNFALNRYITETFEGCKPVFIENYAFSNFFFRRRRRDRRRLKDIADALAKNDIFIHNLITELPLIFIEYLSYFLKNVQNKNNFKNCTIHLSTYYNDAVNILVAYLKENGARVFKYQHGGFYGELEYHPGLELDRKFNEGFVTWGWKLTDHDIPFKALKIKNFIKNYESNLSDNFLFDATLILPKVKSWNRKEIKEDLKLLNDLALQNNLSIAVRFKLAKYENQNFDLSLFKGLQAANPSWSIGRQCAKSRIVLHLKHPTTNFLECIAVNHPVLAVLTNDNPSQIVVPHYKFFLQEKVFHNSFRELIEYLKSNSLRDIWPKITAKEGYKSFKTEFVNTNY